MRPGLYPFRWSVCLLLGSSPKIVPSLLASLCVISSLFASGPSGAAEKTIVFAAASLKDALDHVAAEYRASGGEVTISYAGSGVLARQVERGAPADVYISANVDWMDYLVAGGMVEAQSVVDLLGNQLVVAVRAETAGELTLQSIVGSDRFAMGDPSHVPAGIYAKQALISRGLWETAQSNAVFSENVRVALAQVARAELSAAIVYNSDVFSERRVAALHLFEPSDHSEIIYQGVVLRRDKNLTGARFLTFFQAAIANGDLSRFGFSALATEALRTE